MDSTATGGTLRTGSNGGNPCVVGASSTAALSGIPAAATVVGAYLYWAGSGSTVDSQVTLDGSPLTADRTFTARVRPEPDDLRFLRGFKDVTAQVQATRNGNYTFANLAVDTANPYCSSQAVLAGWSLIVIYQDTSVTGKTIVLYDGFDYRAQRVDLVSTSPGSSPPRRPEGKATYSGVGRGSRTWAAPRRAWCSTAPRCSDALNPVQQPVQLHDQTLGGEHLLRGGPRHLQRVQLCAARDTLATTTVSVASDLVILNAVLLQVKSNVITGTVSRT